MVRDHIVHHGALAGIALVGIAVAGLLHAAPAFAADEAAPMPPDAPLAAQSLAQSPATQPDAVSPNTPLPQPQFGNDAPFTQRTVVDDSGLAGITGMADVKVIEQAANVANTSTISGNIINGDPTTGTISFDGGAFGAFNGLALINTNTGNNVSINSAMNVNVAIQ
ncbi:hypothetical protein WBP06_10930 [Novosphingobium sp. BL-8H]|uniref:hypothetical protein n=1 Tax=Novosphingobium sp. BL-8H TaxID=3127640 RepID=UPI003756EC42